MKLGRLIAFGLVLSSVVALPAAAAAPEQRTITVAATGSVDAGGVAAEWSVGVRVQDESARKAWRASAAAIARITAALEKAGVARSALEASKPSLYPRFDQEAGNVTAFVATRAVDLTIGDSQRAATVIDKAVAAGANYVLGPTFAEAQTDELYKRALAAAVDEARAKSQALADKAGVALGPVISIDESRSYGYEGPRYWGPGSDVPFDPGENEVYASVVVTFAIA